MLIYELKIAGQCYVVTVFPYECMRIYTCTCICAYRHNTHVHTHIHTWADTKAAQDLPHTYSSSISDLRTQSENAHTYALLTVLWANSDSLSLLTNTATELGKKRKGFEGGEMCVCMYIHV